MENILLVVAKQPSPGQTKTRLCPPLNHTQASELYDCFLRDTLDIMRKVPDVQRVVAYLSKNGHGYFQDLAPDMRLVKQVGMSLGERLDNLLTEALAGSSEKAVVMDSDSPTLPPAYLAMAFELLDQADVVLGPTEDGGYYLIGMKKPHPRLLREVQMSTPDVLTDTQELAKRMGVSVALLPPWYDVDTASDLERLQAELIPTPNGSGQHSRGWFQANDWK